MDFISELKWRGLIHDVTPVNMNVLRMAVTRANDEALITRDRMRVDIDAE